MNFQFYCPQGHLLQADSSAAGSVISCPICGTQFIIPAAPAQPAVSAVSTVAPPPIPSQESGNGLDFTGKNRPSVKNANLDSLLGGTASSESSTSSASTTSSDDPLAQMTRRKPSKLATRQPTASAEETKAVLNTATKKKKKAEELDSFRIPCPKGHVLDVDKEMLGERVQCPVCHAVYDLKLENSLEYIKEKQEEEEREEARLGKIWIQRAIIAGILLLLFLVVLMLT